MIISIHTLSNKHIIHIVPPSTSASHQRAAESRPSLQTCSSRERYVSDLPLSPTSTRPPSAPQPPRSSAVRRSRRHSPYTQPRTPRRRRKGLQLVQTAQRVKHLRVQLQTDELAEAAYVAASPRPHLRSPSCTPCSPARAAPSPCRERVACSPNAPPPAAPGDAPRASGSGDSRSGASAHPRGDLRERRRGGPLLRL